MLNIKKILLPVDFPNTSLRVIHQAAALARHFHAEIVMLHVVTAQSHAAGVPEDGPGLAGWDVLAEILQRPEKPGPISRAGTRWPYHPARVGQGGAAQAIVQTAQQEKADSDHDAVPWPHVLPVSSGLCDSESASTGPDARFGPMPTSKNRRRRSLRSVTSCARSLSTPMITKVCRGPRKWPPNLAPVSRSLTSLPAWSFGGLAARYINPRVERGACQ